ncbi:AAA family ATPase [Ralstonia sp. CHL-2022]|uniref:AAA family ATPase n=1 Tax=Ralstonia mojiangensis TaxID=2953895 RepID=A0ABT2L9K1_9RALS|nr:AAA family ATPase [Ralstonia mojiangensis]MCT7297750.1 AAA family ATPase [Ralstonia mojiangensis]MCT7312090.1 AAA family ATPase [Ralstonia mojiangensis]
MNGNNFDRLIGFCFPGLQGRCCEEEFMQIRNLNIHNFRGISTLDWSPGHSFCCLIGSGDSGKSTILDAVEAALSSRWFSFTEADFLNCDTSNTVVIEATVGELSKALKSDERLGLYIRGWTAAGMLRDEPESDDEPVLTVRLTVDATMEPVWDLVCERIDEPRTLSNRDRALFGVVRLAGEDARHLTWGQGSVLARLTGDNRDAAARLASAYRAARESARLEEIESLANAADLAQEFARGLGAYVEGSYAPGLELGRSGLSSGAIALHDDGVPLRLAGLGTRRLATLAIQKSAVAEGAIVLIDEIEHGLEPHRIIGAISRLKADQTDAKGRGRPLGQILMTTHSDIALGESGADCLRVVQTVRPGRLTTLARPKAPDPIRALLRFTPRALFARRILVTEGNTEIGLLLGLRENWLPRHAGVPVEQLGAAIADGNGEQAASMALALSELGYATAIFRDSDTLLSADNIAALSAAGVPVFEYGGGLNTEQALFFAAGDYLVQELLAYARAERGDHFVNDNIAVNIPELGIDEIRADFHLWELNCTLNGNQLRNAIAEVACRKRWFKDQRIGRGLGPIAWRISAQAPSSALSIALTQTEAWLYA